MLVPQWLEGRQDSCSAGGQAASCPPYFGLRQAEKETWNNMTIVIGITWRHVPRKRFCEPFARYVANSLLLVIVADIWIWKQLREVQFLVIIANRKWWKLAGKVAFTSYQCHSSMCSVDVRIYFRRLLRHYLMNIWSRNKSWRHKLLLIFTFEQVLKWRPRAHCCTIADRRWVTQSPWHNCGRRNTSFPSP